MKGLRGQPSYIDDQGGHSVAEDGRPREAGEPPPGRVEALDHGVLLAGDLVHQQREAPVVAVGDRISTGQPIAGVAEGEESAGYLYFEIRRDNRPEDPQEWLR